jgi:hypothetical protein
MAQTRRLIRSRMHATLPGYSSCYQVQAGACRFADGWIKYLISYQTSGLHALRTLHLHLYAQTAELRTRVELAV